MEELTKPVGVEQEEVVVDYTKLSKEELLTELKDLKKQDLKYVGGSLKGIRDAFGSIFREEKSEAFNRFLSEGGHKDDFEYQADATSREFNELANDLSTKLRQYYSDLEAQKITNLNRKNKLLEDLRDLVNQAETEENFQKVKDLQAEWKEIGFVPQANASELFDNYRALLDRFYNNLTLLKDLRDLDRQKNLTAKEEICAKAEALLELESMNEALEKLKELHELYKSVGPVPQDKHEALWERFKKASDDVYEKRQKVIEEFKAQLENNYQAKLQIIQKLQPYTELSSKSIAEWKQYTDEVLAIQQEWKDAGQVPHEKVKDLSKDFWAACKAFFANKNEFFKELDSKREANLKLKEALCEKAEEFRDSENLKEATEGLKNLQKEWKTIGQVPKKHNEAIYQRFRAACDAFFDKKRAKFEEQEKEYEENLAQKEAICEAIVGLSSEASSVETFEAKLEEWNTIGYVPRKSKITIQQKFEKSIKAYLKNLEVDSKEKIKLELSVQVGALKDSPDAQNAIRNKMTQLRKEISGYEGEISTLRTNVEFFANSKSIDKIKADVEAQVAVIEEKIKELKEQLTILRNY
ncbi:MAG: DUF349 domain-containing protein [Cytophagales bacterium]|nr:DUF349 domain-containing protein [Cytophagales bacterium]